MRQVISMSKKRKIFILISLVLSFALLFVVITDMPVFAATVKLVDNDDNQGHSNYNNGFTKYPDSNCYNNDYRIRFYSNPSYYYEYIYNSVVQKTGSMSVYLSVYLNHLSFTDPEASYRVYYYSSTGPTEYYVSTTINQDTAAAGWNPLTTMIISSGSSYTYYSPRTQVRCSNHPYQHTGADGIYASYS